MRILHFSDVHVSAPLGGVPLSRWFGKRALGGANLLRGRGKRFAEAAVKLEALARFAAEQKVAVALFTGDYTALGLEPEYRAARRAVQPLIDAVPTYVNIPGNHDLYVPEALAASRFEEFFGDWLQSDAPDRSVDGLWPLVRLIGNDVAAVAVNSARPNPQPWRSSGRIPAGQLAALGDSLRDERIAGRFVFVLTHYAARLGNGEPDTRLHGLTNADAFLANVADLSRGAILCGHIHHGYRVSIPGVAPPLYCAGSATLAGRESFWLFEIGERRVRATRGGWDGSAYRLLPETEIEH